MPMPLRRSQIISLMLIVCSMALILGAYFFAAKMAREEARQNGERQLQIISLDLESSLEKYESLPYTVAYLPLAVAVLTEPAQSERQQELNLVLQDIQQQARVEAIYLLDPQGKTLASSNWNTATSYLGQNFSFRPYFRDAIKGQAGRFYAIGNTTHLPGYFLAQPVYRHGKASGVPIGVIAVKISLVELEQTWRSSEDPITLSDRNGVVFLGNRSEWQYHSLRPLDKAVQQDIDDTLQYGGKNIAAINSLPARYSAGFGDYLARPIGRLGWQLMLFPAQNKVVQAGMQAALLMLLVLLLSLAIWEARMQKRKRQQEQRTAQQALQQAAADLEQHIAARTQQLLETNQQLAAKNQDLNAAEQVLRSTQDELIQAGKLAMLGQMAAGVTHELNQPLTAIRAFADNAATFLAREQYTRVADNLVHISKASASMGAILAQLKGFARKSQDDVWHDIDAVAAIDAACALLQNEFQRLQVQLHRSLPTSLTVRGDAARLEQVVINLLRNALDAVENVADKQVWLEVRQTDGECILSLRDSGPGLPADVLAHLFEPFYTTKASGKGLGLGLVISLSIIQSMQGSLSAANAETGGAEFCIRLPLYKRASNDCEELI